LIYYKLKKDECSSQGIQMELKELIVNIEKRPQMYINDLNIHILETFLGGYLFGRSCNQELNVMDNAFRRDFNAWIANYYNAPLQTAWNNTIYYYEGNHNKSLERFFDLYKRWYENTEINISNKNR